MYRAPKTQANGAPRRDTCIETCGVDLAYDPTSHPPKSQSPFGKSAYSLFFLYMRAFKLGRQVAGADQPVPDTFDYTNAAVEHDAT